MSHGLATTRGLGSVVALASLVAAACEATPPEPAEVTKAPAPATPAEVTKPAATTKPANAAVATAPATATGQDQASPLRAAAVREGRIGLRTHRGAPVLTLEGEPVALVDGAFTRRPGAGAGLLPDYSSMAYEDLTLGFAGGFDEPQGAWVSTMQNFERASAIYATYRWADAQWQPVVQRKGMLLGHYAALVEREGAVLALQAWAPDPEEQDVWQGKGESESQQSLAHQKKVSKALARQRPAWLRVAGPEVELPSIPRGVGIASVVTDAGGTIFALAREPGLDPWGEPTVLLAWPLGKREAERVEAPELAGASGLGLFANGEHTLLSGVTKDGGGPHPFVAVGRAGQWQRVEASLPGRSDDAPFNVIGAARASDGELWIALGQSWEDAERPVWRKPNDGEWQPVPLPTIGAEAFGPGQAWVRDADDEGQDWVRVERKPVGSEPMVPSALVWAADAVWLAADLDFAYTGSVFQPPRRAVLLTTRAGTEPPALLPSTWELQLERRNHLVRTAKPGDDACKSFSFVLGPAELSTTRPETIAAIRALQAIEEHDAHVGAPHIATLDGAEVLVITGWAHGAEAVTALREAVTTAAGTTPTLDCRIPTLVRMVQSP